jgi:cation diffusion facilitator CzcD-associated flavoprotein CzcO
MAAVVVIGAGQSGLSAGYHLQRRGFTSALDDPGDPRGFVILDAGQAPGGAWSHRWESLRMATVNGIFDLPRFPKPPLDPAEPIDWADLAGGAGYFDQAHFGHEFRAFTGLTPTRYVEVRRRFLREHPGHVLDGWPLPTD